MSPYPYRGVRVNGKVKVSKVDKASPPVCFAFGGNGCQWPEMGRSLYSSSAVFKETLDQCIESGRKVGVDLAPLLIEKVQDKSKFGASHGIAY
jgi:acyl transferase domain-containing protein